MTSSSLPAVASRDGYPEAQRLAASAICGECGGALAVLKQGDRFQAVCGRDHGHRAIKLHEQVEEEQLQQRLANDPKASQALALSHTRAPLTSAAIRSLSDDQLRARIQARFAGATEATPELRVQIGQLARLYDMDPLTDLMIYQGKPYITYEGRLRKLREAAGYHGHAVRPLNRQEKEAWGFRADDLVVQCDVDMGSHGTVSEWGVVRAQGESSPVARANPQQLAIKRAISRASRTAVGVDLPTFLDRGEVIEGEVVAGAISRGPAELPDPEDAARRRFWVTVKADPPDGLGLDEDAAHELLGVTTFSGYPGGYTQALSDLMERAAAVEQPPVIDAETVPEDPSLRCFLGPIPGGGQGFACSVCNQVVGSVRFEDRVIPAAEWLDELQALGIEEPLCGRDARRPITAARNREQLARGRAREAAPAEPASGQTAVEKLGLDDAAPAATADTLPF